MLTPLKFSGTHEAPLEAVLDLVGQKGTDVFAKVAEAVGNTDTNARVIHLQNEDKRFDVTVVKGEQGNAVFWFDFKEVVGSVWDKFAKRFSLPAFKENDPDNVQIAYETPAIDEDNLQLTAYYLKPDEAQNTVTSQKVHLYAGDDFFITTRPLENPSVDRVKKLFSESGRYKTPPELLGVVMRDIINHDRRVIESLSRDYQTLSDKVGQKTTEKVLKDIKHVSDTINTINQSIVRQRGVLSDLMEINDFQASELLNRTDFEGFLKKIDHNLGFLSVHRQQLDGLIQIFRAKEGNELDHRMKWLGTIGLVGIPLTFVPGLMGMNVPIPFASSPYTFGGIAAGSLVLAFGLYKTVKKLVK